MGIGKLLKTADELSRVDDILGYHGTSVEAVLELDKTGRMPNTGIDPEDFWVIHPDCGIKDAVWYAHQIAVRHYLLKALPFEVPSHKHIVAAQGLVDDELARFMLGEYREEFREFMELAGRAGLGEEDVIKIIRSGYHERMGCFLTMSMAMRGDFIDERGGNKMAFYAPDGVEKRYVSAIHPLGEYEWKQLEKLREPVLK